MKKPVSLLLCLALALGLAGCTKQDAQPKTIYIAEQYGTAYAPIALMRELGLLQDLLSPGVTVEWSQLGNTAAIREAMLAGKVDIGCMAIPPFLIGLDGGMEWRVTAGISSIPMGLVARDGSIAGIADIPAAARIALPQPGSIQHILLAMAAQRELGDAARFDNQLVTMSHPDAYTALLAGADIDYHFTTAPYLGQELAAGMTLVLSDVDALGQPYTGIIAVSREEFTAASPTCQAAFLQALEEAVDFLQNEPEQTVEILAPVYGMEPEDLYSELYGAGAAYGTGVAGLDIFVEFMHAAGYIQQAYTLEELVFEGVVTG